MERSTKQKKAILAAMQNAHRPLTPQEILSLAQKTVPALGIATVYRNLRSLLEDGNIRTVELPAEAARYEMTPACHNDHHHHFLCKQCARAFDVHGCAEDFAAMVPSGFIVQSHEITLYGVCKDCVSPKAKCSTAQNSSRKFFSPLVEN